jgi:hypothetical protein
MLEELRVSRSGKDSSDDVAAFLAGLFYADQLKVCGSGSLAIYSKLKDGAFVEMADR